MRWKLKLDRQHLLLWCRFAIYWLCYVIAGLIAGWHLKPRMDEVIFVLLLPVLIVATYAAACFVAAALKVWLWPIGRHRWNGLRLTCNSFFCQRGAKSNKRLPNDIGAP